MTSSWQPSATIETLRKRASALATIRQFFNSRNYLEVETPIMARYGVSDVFLSNIKATFREQVYSLQTSPEYHMKRLLAAGSGPIFQLSRVFRDDELGRWHNPEFTMLEWYQLDIDHHQLMDEVNALLQTILSCRPMIKKTYQQVFIEACNLDPFNADTNQYKHVLKRFDLGNVFGDEPTSHDTYLFLLMSHVVEPALATAGAPVAVYDFPPSQAALAQINNSVAQRFEVYYQGVELANGFHELTDVNAQELRFMQDAATREHMGLPFVEADLYLLDALHQGLPACSGVALGIDRLLALAFNYSSITPTLSFDFSRA